VSEPAIALLRSSFDSAHEWLEGTLSDVDNEVANHVPPGLSASVGANYIHHLTTEDFLLKYLTRGTPLMGAEWAGRTGASTMPPPGDWSEWGKTVQVDMPTAREYAKAVYAATDDYLASLSDADLDAPANISELGFPPMSVGRFLGGMILINAGAHCGEISVIKGLQGLRGYPF
jgi:hypothetical protein